MSLHNPFEWAKNPRPSIFLGQPGFPPDGKTRSQQASEAVDRRTAATGRNPGTVAGLRRADRLATLIPNAYSRTSGVK